VTFGHSCTYYLNKYYMDHHVYNINGILSYFIATDIHVRKHFEVCK